MLCFTFSLVVTLSPSPFSSDLTSSTSPNQIQTHIPSFSNVDDIYHVHLRQKLKSSKWTSIRTIS